jgi:hypothetical protein
MDPINATPFFDERFIINFNKHRMTSIGTQMYTYDRCSSIFSRIQGKDCVDNPTPIEIYLETPISLATRHAKSPVRVQPSKRIKLMVSVALKNLVKI